MRTINQVQTELKVARHERFVASQKLNVSGERFQELRCLKLEQELQELRQSHTTIVQNRLAPYFAGLGI